MNSIYRAGNLVLVAAVTSILAVPVARAALPEPWTSTDIGSVGLAGSGSETGGQFTVRGSGADIFGTADAFHYVYQRLNGNTQIVARMTSVQATHAWSKAGVMIREGLTANSRHAFALLSGSSGVSFQSRATTGGSSTS